MQVPWPKPQCVDGPKLPRLPYTTQQKLCHQETDGHVRSTPQPRKHIRPVSLDVINLSTLYRLHFFAKHKIYIGINEDSQQNNSNPIMSRLPALMMFQHKTAQGGMVHPLPVIPKTQLSCRLARLKPDSVPIQLVVATHEIPGLGVVAKSSKQNILQPPISKISQGALNGTMKNPERTPQSSIASSA